MEKNSLIEIWKDVVGYESTHQISNLGRVRVKERTIHTSTGNRIYKSKLLLICFITTSLLLPLYIMLRSVKAF